MPFSCPKGAQERLIARVSAYLFSGGPWVDLDDEGNSRVLRGWTLAVWIFAAKLPNSDLNFAVDFWWVFSSYFFQGIRPEKIHQKIPCKIHPGLCSEKFPSDFCRSLFLRVLSHRKRENQVPPKTPLVRCSIPWPFFSRKLCRTSTENEGKSQEDRTLISDFSNRPWRNLPPTWAIYMATRRPAHNMRIHMDFLYGFP